MNRNFLPTAIIITLILLIANWYLLNTGFSQNTLGQAEETFGQNFTFFEEVEQEKEKELRQSQIATPPSLNRTNATTTPKLLFPQPTTPMSIIGENVYIVWSTNKTGNWEIMLRISNDNGTSFGEKINLSNSTETDSQNPYLVVSGNKVLVSWGESTLDGIVAESAVRISTNGGLTFGPILKLSDEGTIGEKQGFSDFSTYENSDYGIEMSYPSDWVIRYEEDDDNEGVNDVAGFYSPLENRLDKYRERLWISFDNLLGENITLGQYTKEIIDLDNETFQDFNLLDYDTDNTIFAGYPGYRLIYTRTLGNDTTIKEMEIGTRIADKVYFLRYYAEAEKYADFLPVIQDMINSFRIER